VEAEAEEEARRGRRRGRRRGVEGRGGEEAGWIGAGRSAGAQCTLIGGGKRWPTQDHWVCKDVRVDVGGMCAGSG